MTTEFTWLAEQLNVAPGEDPLVNVIQTIHWRCNALAEDGLTATAYGTVALSSPDPEAFEVYEGMTEAQVVGWMKDALGTEEVARIEANLAGEINKRRNPPVVPMTPPWAA